MSTQVLPTVDISFAPSLKANVRETKQTVSVLTRDQLIDTVALLIEDMISDRSSKYTSVDQIPNVTPFHAKKVAAISIRNYIKRFADNSNCHDNVFVLALIFLDRLGEEVPDFDLDSFNALRLLLLSMTMACKSYDDAYYKNSYYAKIGGVSTEEFNSLEKEYLVNYIQFRLYVDPEQYDSYYQDLVNFHQDQNTDNEAL